MSQKAIRVCLPHALPFTIQQNLVDTLPVHIPCLLVKGLHFFAVVAECGRGGFGWHPKIIFSS